MPDKNQISDALLRYKRVDLAAESLGLGLRRMYRFMARYNLTLKAVLSWPSMPRSVSNDAPVLATPSEAKPQPAAAPAKPERNILRQTASDFTGPYRGDAGGSGSGSPRSADDLLDRYRRLKGK